MPELTQQEIEAVRNLITNEVSIDPLTPAQKWGVLKVVSTMLVGGFALLGVAGYFVVENAAKVRAGTVAADDIANSLKEKPTFVTAVSEKVGAIPSGAVIAFDDGEGCPEGWTDFANTKGRTIIGAGQGAKLSNRDFGELGGDESTLLSINELPRHRHSISTSAQDDDQHSGLAGSGRDGGINQVFEPNAPSLGGHGVKREVMSFSGGNASGETEKHNNMPPYIALYFCKKNAS